MNLRKGIYYDTTPPFKNICLGSLPKGLRFSNQHPDKIQGTPEEMGTFTVYERQYNEETKKVKYKKHKISVI